MSDWHEKQKETNWQLSSVAANIVGIILTLRNISVLHKVNIVFL